MSRLLPGLLLPSVLVVALLAAAPARLLSHVLPSQQLVMHGYSGTLWQGRAARCAMASPSGYFHMGSVEWSLDPLSVLLLSPTLTVRSAWGRQQISGQIQLSDTRSFSLREFEASVSAVVLQQFLPVAVGGDFGANILHLRVVDGFPVEGEGRLLWQGAGWQSSQGMMPLGSYAVDFSQAQDSALQAAVVTISGPVEARGSVTLSNQRYDTDVLLSSDSGLNAELKQALSLIAQPVDEGYRIVLNGQLNELEN